MTRTANSLRIRSTILAGTALVVGSAFFAFGLAGCQPTVNPTSPSAKEIPEGTPCQSPEALIDDGDDNNNQTAVVDGRGGYWYTFVDDVGTTVEPTAGAHGGTFEMASGGAEGSPYAANFKGTVATGEIVYAGLGMNFLDPKGGYDASKYGGISFYAKKGPGSTGKVRLKVPDKNTDPDGGVCTECFNDFGMDLTLTEEWQQYTIPFFALKQQPGWGSPKRMSVDESALYGIQFQVAEAGATYDIWVDQLRFTGCGAEGQ